MEETPACQGGVAVVEAGNDKRGSSWSRLDLDARLLRPHGPFIRSARPPAANAERLGQPRSETRGNPTGREPIDVICAGMYRACSTWQYEVVAHLIEQLRGGKRLGYLTSEQYNERSRRDALDQPPTPEGGRPWRTIKSHEGDRSFARALAQGRALAVYAHRDVRDVVFSLMYKRGMTFDQLLRQGMIHQILANDRFWMGQPDVLIQRYDDLLADPVGGVKELARHLGIALSASEAAQIAGLYSRESNRARSETLERRLKESGVNLESAAGVQICDPTTLLHWNHMRKTGAGSWRTSATPQEIATLHRLCGRWLKTRGYPAGPVPTQTVSLSFHALRERVRGSLPDGGPLDVSGAERLATVPRDGARRETHAGTAGADECRRHGLVRPGAGGSRCRDDHGRDRCPSWLQSTIEAIRQGEPARSSWASQCTKR